jgi:hypothetical protein
VPQSAELLELNVPDSRRAQRRAQCVAIELRIVPRAGNRSYIDHALDAMEAKQLDEFGK